MKQVVSVVHRSRLGRSAVLRLDIVLVERPVAGERILGHEYRVGAVHRDVEVVEVERREEEAADRGNHESGMRVKDKETYLEVAVFVRVLGESCSNIPVRLKTSFRKTRSRTHLGLRDVVHPNVDPGNDVLLVEALPEQIVQLLDSIHDKAVTHPSKNRSKSTGGAPGSWRFQALDDEGSVSLR